MNKLFRLTVIIVFAFILLSGCDAELNSSVGEDTTIDNIKVTEEVTAKILTDEDFVIKNKGTYLELGGLIDDMKIDDKLIRYRPLSEKRAYEAYYYENCTILESLGIFSITLITPKFETARGIKVGDSMDKVFKNYGVMEKDDEFSDYTYYGPDMQKIIFEVDENDIITEIELAVAG